MVGINDVHAFLERNLPEYERRHIVQICKFYLQQRKISDKKPLATTYCRWQDFKRFILWDWQGLEQEGGAVKVFVHAPKVYCTCGAKMIIRVNRESKEKFYGCSKYPKCRETKYYE